MPLFVEKLISEVEARPALYNVKLKEYNNREVKAECWNEVAKALYNDWDSPELSEKVREERVANLMKRWKTLRDAFVKYHRGATLGIGKAASAKKKYIYYENLVFLLPFLKGVQCKRSRPRASRSAADSDDSNTEEEDSVVVKDESTNENDIEIPSKKRKFEDLNVDSGKQATLETSLASAKELTNNLATNLQMQLEEKSSDKYGHKAFLLSYLPVLDSIPLQQSMFLRGQICEVFTNYFAIQENN